MTKEQCFIGGPSPNLNNLATKRIKHVRYVNTDWFQGAPTVRYSGKQSQEEFVRDRQYDWLTNEVMIIMQAKNINYSNTTALEHY